MRIPFYSLRVDDLTETVAGVCVPMQTGSLDSAAAMATGIPTAATGEVAGLEAAMGATS